MLPALLVFFFVEETFLGNPRIFGLKTTRILQNDVLTPKINGQSNLPNFRIFVLTKLL